VPWADVLYAADLTWWDAHPDALQFHGEKVTQNEQAATKHDLQHIKSKPGVGIGNDFVYTGKGNSGFQAVNLAIQRGCTEVILVGFDMCKVGGQKHWHPDHPGANPSDGMLAGWAQAFQQFAPIAKSRGVRILNASPSSILTAYEKVTLESVSRTPCAGVWGVLKSGGWCTVEYAQRLAAAVSSRTKVPFRLLTDMVVPGVECVPLQHNLPGWWSKLELCRPDIVGDALYFDLDTILYGDIEPLVNFGRLGLLRDFYRADVYESGVMYLPEWARKAVWQHWSVNPQRWMSGRFVGDGAFIHHALYGRGNALQDGVSGIHSYKVHGKRQDTRVLCYHGSPRPHETRHWNDVPGHG
jgi:hypothetical protein